MAPRRARGLAACLFSVATCAVFFMGEVTPLPVPLYFPLARRWAFSPPAGAGELSMDWYGRSLLALLAGGAVALCGYAALRRLRRPPSPTRALMLWLAYTATALFLCGTLYAYKLFTREVVPQPLPAWYEPR